MQAQRVRLHPAGRWILGIGLPVAIGAIVAMWGVGLYGAAPARRPPSQHAQGNEAKGRTHWQTGIGLFRSRVETLPAEVRELISEHDIYRLDPTLAQRLPLNLPDKVWAVPGRGVLCLVDFDESRSVGRTCDSKQDVLNGGLMMTRLFTGGGAKDRRQIFGVLPNAASAAYVTTGKHIVRVPVHRNVFLHEDSVPVPPDRLFARLGAAVRWVR